MPNTHRLCARPRAAAGCQVSWDRLGLSQHGKPGSVTDAPSHPVTLASGKDRSSVVTAQFPAPVTGGHSLTCRPRACPAHRLLGASGGRAQRALGPCGRQTAGLRGWSVRRAGGRALPGGLRAAGQPRASTVRALVFVLGRKGLWGWGDRADPHVFGETWPRRGEGCVPAWTGCHREGGVEGVREGEGQGLWGLREVPTRGLGAAGRGRLGSSGGSLSVLFDWLLALQQRGRGGGREGPAPLGRLPPDGPPMGVTSSSGV